MWSWGFSVVYLPVLQLAIISTLKGLVIANLRSRFLAHVGDRLCALIFNFLWGKLLNWRSMLIVAIAMQYMIWTVGLFIYLACKLYILVRLWAFADPEIFYLQNCLFFGRCLIYGWLLLNVMAFILAVIQSTQFFSNWGWIFVSARISDIILLTPIYYLFYFVFERRRIRNETIIRTLVWLDPYIRCWSILPSALLVAGLYLLVYRPGLKTTRDSFWVEFKSFLFYWNDSFSGGGFGANGTDDYNSISLYRLTVNFFIITPLTGIVLLALRWVWCNVGFEIILESNPNAQYRIFRRQCSTIKHYRALKIYGIKIPHPCSHDTAKKRLRIFTHSPYFNNTWVAPGDLNGDPLPQFIADKPDKSIDPAGPRVPETNSERQKLMMKLVKEYEDILRRSK